MEKFVIFSSICLFLLSFELVRCDQGSGEVSPDQEGQLQLIYQRNNDDEINNWAIDGLGLDHPTWSWSGAGPPNDFRHPNPFFRNSKRAIFGLLGLATKRPHKTAAELQYLPPDDTFLHVRGKKRSAPAPVLLPSSAYLLRASYPLVNLDGDMNSKA